MFSKLTGRAGPTLGAANSGGGSPPVITSPSSLVTGTVGTIYPTTTFTATGTAPITWSIPPGGGTLPTGMTFTSGGVLSGTPTATASGSITFRAANAYGYADRTLTLTVGAAAAPVITTTSLYPAFTGGLYTQFLQASSATTVTWSLVAGSLPSNVSLRSDGRIMGVCGTAAGTTLTGLRFRATNAYGFSETGLLSIEVRAISASAASPDPQTIPNAVVGVPYSYQMLYTPTSLPVTFVVFDGRLPAGLTMSSTGLITGTPTQADYGQFIVNVFNDQGTGRKPLYLPDIDPSAGHEGFAFGTTLTAGGAYQIAPFIIQSDPDYVITNVPYSFQLTAIGMDTGQPATAPLTWVITSGSLPTGLSFNTSTAIISGTCTATPADYSVTFTVSNSLGSHSKTLVFNVQAKTSARVYQNDLTWVGSFRVPNLTPNNFHDSGSNSFSKGIALSADRTRLFVTGGSASVGNVGIAEISIPALVQSTTVTALNTASIVQPFIDGIDGRVNDIRYPANGVCSKGIAVHGGYLYSIATDFYEGLESTLKNFFRRSLTLTNPGGVVIGQINATAPGAAGERGARYFAGYMENIPTRAQTDYSIGPVMAGGFSGSGAGSMSAGPSLLAFNPSGLTEGSRVIGKELLGYPLSTSPPFSLTTLMSNGTLTGYDTNKWWTTGVSTLNGGVWLNSATKRAVLFFGSHPRGQSWYGLKSAGGAFLASDVAVSSVSGQVTDYVTNAKAWHAYPYGSQVWAYDESEVAAVAAGTKSPDAARLYTVWKLDAPVMSNPSDQGYRSAGWIYGVAHDQVSRRIYVGVAFGEVVSEFETLPLIHVYEYPN